MPVIVCSIINTSNNKNSSQEMILETSINPRYHSNCTCLTADTTHRAQKALALTQLARESSTDYCVLLSGSGATSGHTHHGSHQPPLLWGYGCDRNSPSLPLIQFTVLESYHSNMKLSTPKYTSGGWLFFVQIHNSF